MVKIIILVFSFLFLNVSAVSAHDFYQPVLVINNKLVSHTVIPAKSVENFEFTHEVAAENYLVMQPINFSIDIFKIDKPADWVKKAKLSLDFGDGSKQAGVVGQHSYQKIGTYVVSLYGQSEDTTPQLLSQVRLQILPMAGYKLAQPIIIVDKKEVSDPKKEKLEIKFDHPLDIDGSQSIAGSTKIVDYQWDLGDGSASNVDQLTHQFGQQHYNTFIVLRLKDENGFITDSYVEVVNGVTNQKTANNTIQNPTQSPALKYGLIGLGLVLGLITLSFVSRKLYLKNQKRA